ncbi:metallophosphoesterase [uncultured Alistipes sp.]|uniref:metallophosphoesterase family protein n=1 Tax=uncultured Alistipes sp. TaxID=538949 RepID=UPI00262927BA|nr:metallophosphoesterase [uncultured Alistipes sp.]
MKRCATAMLAAATAAACQVDYHPYDTRIDGECGINAKNIARIEASTAGKSAIRFAVISDTQRWYDETREAVSALNARGDIDFVLHTGDMADFGMKAEFERQRDILNRLHVPYVVLLGNHDCLATGEEIFRTIFGDFNTAFTAGNVRILCLNTNALEFDLREAVPNFEFIETELADFPPEASKTIVAMHAKPYTEQFGDNVAKGFQYLITRFPDLQCCINGHGHNYKVVDLFGDGVLYYECDNIAKKSYLLFTVNDEGYACERIEF